MRALQIVWVRWIVVAAMLGVAGVGAANAQSWPSKPIKWVVPFAPGGLADNTSRAAAQGMSEQLGQPVVIENRPGANGGVGSAYVAKQAPDGYTILTGSTGTHAINPHLYRNPGYDALKDFEPVSALVDYELGLVVNAKSEYRTGADVIAAARSRPGEVSYGSSGPGSSNHLVSEMLGVLAGVKFVHVPYKGDGPALLDLVGGRLVFMFTPISSALQYERTGQLRLLATTGSRPHPAAPRVPLFKDTVPRMEFAGWNGIFAPAGTPKEVQNRLATALIAAMQRPEMKSVLTGVDAAATMPDVFAQRVRREYVLWQEIVQKSGARID